MRRAGGDPVSDALPAALGVMVYASWCLPESVRNTRPAVLGLLLLFGAVWLYAALVRAGRAALPTGLAARLHRPGTWRVVPLFLGLVALPSAVRALWEALAAWTGAGR